MQRPNGSGKLRSNAIGKGLLQTHIIEVSESASHTLRTPKTRPKKYAYPRTSCSCKAQLEVASCYGPGSRGLYYKHSARQPICKRWLRGPQPECIIRRAGFRPSGLCYLIAERSNPHSRPSAN